jgi:hypothetical protein
MHKALDSIPRTANKIKLQKGLLEHFVLNERD